MRRRVVLIVSQDAALRAALARAVRAADYTVELAEGAKRARELAAKGNIDLAIVAADQERPADVAMVRELRDRVGRLVLAHDPRRLEPPLSEVLGLALPLDEPELLSRIAQALAAPPSAQEPASPPSTLLRFSGCTLDIDGHAFLDPDGQEVPLTRTEFALLLAFARRPLRALSREQLRNAVTGSELEPYERSMDMLVSRLRRKIEPDSKVPQFIVTVPGAGYKLAVRPLQVEAPTLAAEHTSRSARPVVPPGRAERRYLTILCCGVVGLTPLSTEIEPEDLQAMITTLHGACRESIERLGGTVASFLGNSLVAYFGYPEAHENDEERAIRAGLELIKKAGGLDIERVRLRIGIATGSAVISDLVVTGDSRECTALGEAPRLADRLQALAAPGTIIIAADTRRLAGRAFQYCKTKMATDDDFPEPVPVWQVVRERPFAGRFAAHRASPMMRLVGREEENELLLRRWSPARRGSGQVVLLTGEPGIGKSRLAVELEERLATEKHTRLRYFGSPHHTDSPLFPVAAQLTRAAQFAPGDSADEKLVKLKALLDCTGAGARQGLPLLADLLSIPVKDAQLQQISPQLRKERTFAALLDWFERLSAQQPILAIFEDLQWADSTSLELLALVVERVPRLPVLLLATARPEFAAPWADHAHVLTRPLGRLARRESRALVAAVGEGTLSEPVVDEILARADGVPLFIEELTKMVLESPPRRDGARRLGPAASVWPEDIPATLQGSLLARLDRLGPAKEIAQIGAAIGPTFSFDLLRALDVMEEAELGRALDRITDSGLVFRQGPPSHPVYCFKHALVRDAAYAILSRRRRQGLHGRIAEALRANFSEMVETQPELLAHHCAEAGDVAEAIAYGERAAERALFRSATAEVLAHIGRALALLATLQDGDEKRRQELKLQILRYRALVAHRGHTAQETDQALSRARELCEALGDQIQLPFVIYGQWSAAWSRAAYATALEHGRAILQCAERSEDPAGVAYGHFTIGVCLLWMGALSEARRHLETAVAHDRVQLPGGRLITWGEELPRVVALLMLYGNLSLLGWPVRAEAMARRASDAFEGVSQPYSRTIVLSVMCRAHAVRRDAPRLLETATELFTLTSEQGYPHFAANSMVFRGWALAFSGEPEQGAALASAGIAQCRALGFLAWLSPFLVMLAECQAKVGDVAGALQTLAEVEDVTRKTGERFWEAELHRLRGEIYGNDGGHPRDEEACFRRALDVARGQEARLLELRAATSLARFYRRNGRQAEARDALTPVYDWFTEGHDDADLQDAKTVLDSLR